MEKFIKNGIVKEIKDIVANSTREVKGETIKVKVYLPSADEVIADGWVRYIKQKPSESEIDAAIMLRIRRKQEAAIIAEIETLSDDEALEVKALYPTWESFIGKQVKKGKRLYYNEGLYKVLQTHDVQEQFPPSKETASLYTEVNEKNKGTKDDPIPYNNNMQLELGKFYSQNGKVYECIRDSGQPVYEDMDKLADYGFVKLV